MLVDQVAGLTAADAVLGALFHLDRGFRRGVTAMADHALAASPADAQIVFVQGPSSDHPRVIRVALLSAEVRNFMAASLGP